jgi:hypothetical protein
MARYFFDWRDNANFDEDDEGIELPDLQAVKVEASRSLLERARDILPGLDRHSLSIEVRDNSGRRLLSIILILEIRDLAPGMSGSTSS